MLLLAHHIPVEVRTVAFLEVLEEQTRLDALPVVRWEGPLP